MEEFLIDLEQLKVERGKSLVLADHLNKIVDAMIENRKCIIEHEAALKKKRSSKKSSARRKVPQK